MDNTKPTRAEIKGALGRIESVSEIFEYGDMSAEADGNILAAAYRATQRPAQIIGRIIGYVIAAAIGVIALAGLLAAVKVLVGVVG